MTFQPFHAICKPLESLAEKTVPCYYHAYHTIRKSLKTNGATSYQACCPNPPIPPIGGKGTLVVPTHPTGRGCENFFSSSRWCSLRKALRQSDTHAAPPRSRAVAGKKRAASYEAARV